MHDLCDIDCPFKTHCGYCGLTECTNPEGWQHAAEKGRRSVDEYMNALFADDNGDYYDYFV